MKKLINVLFSGLLASVGMSASAQTPDVDGQWDTPIDTGIVSVHLVMMPNGKVVTWEEGGQGRPLTDEIRLWDPITEQVSTPTLPPYDIFCSGHSVMPDGRVFVQGGHDEADAVGHSRSAMYDPWTNEWIQGIPNMNAGRWYSTNTILPDGDVLVLNGAIDSYTNKNLLPQILDFETKTWRNLTNAVSGAAMGADFYPRMFVAPNGRIFKAGPDADTWWLNTDGLGQWTQGPTMRWGNFRGYSSSVMYEEGKILIAGGGEQPPTATAEVIDLNQANPQWQWTSAMNYPRRHLNLTIMADGKILATGGTSSNGFNNGANSVYAAEQWDPATGQWEELSAQSRSRVYHSTAVLLPDARVLIAGGGRPQADGGIDNRDIEVFSPPYLFQGPRPEIIDAPDAVGYGNAFDVEVANPENITAVHFIRLGAATHAFNQTQGINRLSWSVTGNGLNVNAPTDPNLAQPGYYMLFILDDGVPSVAKIMRFGDTTPPTVPANLAASTIDTTEFNLSWSASTDNILVDSYNVYVDGVLHTNTTNTNAQITGLFAETTYAITVAARDINGNLSVESTALNVTTAQPGQNPPTANAGTNVFVTPGQTFTLDGSASTDVDGQLLTYEWKLNGQVVGTAATLENSFVASGVYLYELTVSDGLYTDTDKVAVSVLDATNLLTNGDFSNGVVGWDTSAQDGGDATFSNDAGRMLVDIAVPGEQFYSIQIAQLVGLTAGETYTLDFDVMSDGTPRPVDVIVEQLDTWIPYATEQFTITAAANTMQRFSVTWTQSETDATAKIGFHLGANNADQVRFDNMFLQGGPGGNLPPVADAGNDAAAYTGISASLISQSYDQDTGPNALTYTWTQISGPDAALTDANTASPSFTAPSAGTYEFTLTVNDGDLNSNTDTVVITVTDFENTAPTANAGADQILSVGQLVTLDGSASNDVDGLPAPLSYSWTQETGPTVTLSDNTAATPSFTADLVGSYVFKLVVNDGEVDSASDLVVITVGDSPIGEVTNLLTNGDFSNGLANWEEVVVAPAAGGAAIENGEMHFSVTATGDQDWNLQLFQAVGLTAGTTYTLSFDARTDALPRTVKVHIEHNGAPWTAYNTEIVNIDAANQTQSFSVQWTQDTTDADVKIGFHFANTNVNDVWLDNIVLNDGTSTGGNIAPVANAGFDHAVLTGTEVTLDGSLSVDPDSAPNALTYNWIPASGPETVNWTSPAGSATRSFIPGTAGTYTFALQVNDGEASSVTDTVSVVVTDPNVPPIADAGPDQTVMVGSLVTMDATASNDPDNGPSPLAYFWTQVSGPQANLSDLNAEQPTWTANEVGIYSFSFVVDDGEDGSNIDLVEITVIPAGNQAPVANAGEDQIVTVGDFVTLDGSASSDPEGSNLTYTWTQTGGAAVTLNDANTIAPNFTPSESGSFVFSLVVNDGEDDSTVDTMIVTVEPPNMAPISDAGADQTVFLGDTVTLDASGSSDPDFGPEAMTYAWSQTAGTSVTLSALDVQKPTFIAPELGSYDFTLFVFDGEVTSIADTVTITVEPVPNMAPIADAGTDQTLIIGSDVNLDGSASNDPDNGPSPLTYTWTQISGPSVSLDNANAANPTFTPAGIGSYEFNLLVSDGELDSTQATLDPNKSLFVTELSILENFQIATVLQKILDDSFDSTKTPADLIFEMATLRQGCEDFNGFSQADDPANPEFCSEPGANLDLFEAAVNPNLTYYRPIALVNRFDLADKDGTHCGEYRIAYAGNNIVEPRVNFFIFEALLPNPSPELGAEGCRPVAQFWADLTNERVLANRSTALQDFYFNGVNGIAPAISADHFRGVENGSGKIRLNARVDQSSNWVFMEFHTQVANACAPNCSVEMVQATIKDTPFPALAGDDEALSLDFQNAVLASIETEGEGLLANTITSLSINLPDQFNVGRQHSSALPTPGVIEQMSPAFAAAIQTKLDSIGSTLTPSNIITRVHTLSCAGCHNQHSNELGGPLNLDSSTQLVEFLSINEETGPDGQRFELKPSILNTFVPERAAVLQNFLDNSTVTINVVAEPDEDADGIPDSSDLCFGTPAGEAIDANGCSDTQKDSDNDGVNDATDTCANTPAGESVDANGCSDTQKDTDNDGVNDATDTCANTPAGESVDAVGCSSSQIDSDNDGVMDNADTCANTPAGATVDANGCPSDSDADGVLDGLDQCASTPVGATVDANGCPSDQDNDGVFDGIDQCANTPAGALVTDDGCPLDSDNDGVFDGLDLCPGTPAGATVDSNGCDASPYDLLIVQAETMATNNGFLTEDTTDVGGGTNIGWTDAGDYAIYDITELPETGNYQFSVRHAGAAAVASITISSADGATLYANLPGIGGTGGWQVWETAAFDFELPAGITQFRMTANGDALNFNWFSIESDYDNDDVRGSADLCEGTPAGATVNADGCAGSQLDGDNDGVTGAADLCPSTPAGATVDANGCAESEKDDDNDGVSNDVDVCANTAANVLVDATGCGIDTDNDGVFDGIDQCAGTPAGASVNSVGCPSDADNDGVADGIDQCNSTPADVIVDATGCGIDSDADGVFDGLDQCANTATGTVVNQISQMVVALDISWDAPTIAGSITDTNWAGLGSANDIWVVTLDVNNIDLDNDFAASETDGEVAIAINSTTASPEGISPADGHIGLFSADFLVKSLSQAEIDSYGAVRFEDNLRGQVNFQPGYNWAFTRRISNFSSSSSFTDEALLAELNNVGGTVVVQERFLKSAIAQHDKLGTAVILSVVQSDAGCPVLADADNDGIVDGIDECENTTASAISPLGCALDSDNDTVIDDNDLCPATQAGVVVDIDGCGIDSDSDGVFDGLDSCANTPAGEAVDANGCAASQIDSDNDGVFDNADNCANTPAGEAVDANGCSASQTDADNDGVFDSADNCANTPAGESVDVNGCSDTQKDSDNDGVNDATDTCANTPAGEAVNANGCAASQIDSDNDGVSDNLDLCAGTAQGEPVDADGCSDTQRDSDNDGVSDADDLCAATPAGETADANGCSDSQKDTDVDGVNDASDQCDNTPSGAVVDAVGCGVDSDNDGVFDGLDLCDGTPAGESVNTSGCSASQLDADNDGVSDADDLCPGTPAGTVVDATGCEQASQEIARIEAEDYDNATDTTVGNEGGATQCTYNGLNVDIENTTDDATCNVGWTAAGETLDYNVGAAGGVYDVTLRLAGAGAGETVELLVDGISAGTVTTVGGGWQAWNDYVIQNVSIPSNSVLQVVFQTGGVNFNYMDFALDGGDTGTATNLLSSDGTIPGQGAFGNYVDAAGAGNGVSFAGGEITFTVATAMANAWQVQVTHNIALTAGTEYTVCFDARAAAGRTLEYNFDAGGTPDYASLMPSAGEVANLTTSYQQFSTTFIAAGTDTTARLTINAGDLAINTFVDNIGVYEGAACGTP